MGPYLDTCLTRAHLCRRTVRLRCLLAVLRTLPCPPGSPVPPPPSPSRRNCGCTWRSPPPPPLTLTGRALLKSGRARRAGLSPGHVRAYFKGPDTPPAQTTPTPAFCGRAGLEGREAGPVRRGKRGWSQRPANGRAEALGPSANRTEDTPFGQLFHVSSFTTRLGESYSYVARHINSAFSAAVAWETPSRAVTEETTPPSATRRKRKSVAEVRGAGEGSDPVQVPEASGTRRDPAPAKPTDPRVWDPLNFASYFVATATDDATREPTPARDSPRGKFRLVATDTRAPEPPGSPTTSPTLRGGPPPPASTNQEADAQQHRTPGLFHISSLATSFGESYAQVAQHINRCYRSQGRAEEEEGAGLQLNDWQEAGANEKAGSGGEAVGLAEALEASANRTEDSPLGQAAQLFHVSSFTTRLAESYSYVARHINSAFSAAVAWETPSRAVAEETTPPSATWRKRKSVAEVRGAGEVSEPVQVPEASGTKRDPASEKPPDPRVWDPLNFAGYFGATTTDDATREPTPARDSPGVRFRSVAMDTRAPDPAGSLTGPKLRGGPPPPGTNQEAEAQQHRTPGLFHISSLATSFGESYAQVANHINRFYRSQGSGEEEEGAGLQLNDWQEVGTNEKAGSGGEAVGLAEALEASANRTEDTPLGQLFHVSSFTTRLGESYSYVARHINSAFSAAVAWETPSRAVAGEMTPSEEEEEEEGAGLQQDDWREAGYAAVPAQGGAQSFFRTAVSDLLGSYMGAEPSSRAVQSPAGTMRSTQVIGGRSQAETKTRVLVRKLQQADDPTSLNACVEELNRHLIRYPACTAVAWQEKAAPALLRARRRFQGDGRELQGAVRESLALIGYVDAVRGRGIRILSIDGGGTRGVVPLQVLKRLEAGTGRQVHQLFDYICGVSTGAVLAFMLGLVRLPLVECEEMYSRFGAEVFSQNPLVGTVKMGWSHSYYSTSTWEQLLREKLGDKVLIKTARDELSPKVSAVSAVVNWGTTPKAFVFRNYNHAPGRLSRYAGGAGHQLWQAVRASSAAPGYFREFPLHSDIHQDGALILNNPCALAVHESRLLWPARPFQCVLSLGTGRHDNVMKGPVTSTSLRSKISNLISSATDTEGVHTLLDDLLSPNTYFRFNPTLSSEVSLDECRPGALDLLRADTRLYLDRNQPKVERLCRALGPERGALQRAGDRVRERAWELQHRWA